MSASMRVDFFAPEQLFLSLFGRAHTWIIICVIHLNRGSLLHDQTRFLSTTAQRNRRRRRCRQSAHARAPKKSNVLLPHGRFDTVASRHLFSTKFESCIKSFVLILIVLFSIANSTCLVNREPALSFAFFSFRLSIEVAFIAQCNIEANSQRCSTHQKLCRSNEAAQQRIRNKKKRHREYHRLILLKK